MTIYIELVNSSEKFLIIANWTFYMAAWKAVDKRKYFEYLPQFEVVEGKEITYMVMGVDNNQQAKALAIYYHKAKANGTISEYRLD